MNNEVIARPKPKQSRTYEIAALVLRLARNDNGKQFATAALGFALTLQTVLILRPGMLGGIPWSLATIGVYASDIVLLIAAVVGFVRAWHGRLPPPPPLQGGGEKRKKFSPLLSEGEREGVARGSRHRPFAALVLFVVVAGVNTWMSTDPALSAVGWLRILLFLLALVGIPAWSASTRRAFLGGFLLAMLGHVIFGFVQFFTLEAQPSTLLGIAAHSAWTLGDSVITAPGERWLRAYGGFPHPNVFGTALLVAVVALVNVLPSPSSSPSKREGEKKRGWPRLVFLNVAFCILTFALVLSFSRSAWLGFVILLVMMARTRTAPEKHDRVKLEQVGSAPVLRRLVRSLAGIGAIAFAVFLLLLWPLIVPRFTGSTPNEQRSITERSRSVEAAIERASVPPYLGVGLHAMPKSRWEWRPQQYERKVRQEQQLQRYGQRFTPWDLAQPTHNVPLLALAEIGPIGVFVLVIVVVSFARHSLFFSSSVLQFFRSGLWLVLAPSLLFDHHLWSLPIGLALLFVLAVAISRAERLPPVSAT